MLFHIFCCSYRYISNQIIKLEINRIQTFVSGTRKVCECFKPFRLVRLPVLWVFVCVHLCSYMHMVDNQHWLSNLECRKLA